MRNALGIFLLFETLSIGLSKIDGLVPIAFGVYYIHLWYTGAYRANCVWGCILFIAIAIAVAVGVGPIRLMYVVYWFLLRGRHSRGGCLVSRLDRESGRRNWCYVLEVDLIPYYCKEWWQRVTYAWAVRPMSLFMFMSSWQFTMILICLGHASN